MRRVIAVVLIVLGCARGAEALTVRDVIELSRAGLGEEVLLALIEVNRGVYAIDRATLLALKEAGVGERVIVALIRSGREQPTEEQSIWDPARWAAEDVPEPAAPAPVVVIEHHAPPEVREVAVPVPVYVAVPTPGPRHRSRLRAPVESTFEPFQTGPPPSRPSTAPTSSPVYWGFGGKRRPDAWGPAEHKAEPPKDAPKDDARESRRQ